MPAGSGGAFMKLGRTTGLETPAVEQLSDRRAIARRIGRNIGIVVTGNAATAALGVITLALNARTLGAAGLGVLVLILTIATLIDRIFAFQTWQPLVKLGAEALAEGDRVRVGELTTVAFMFDAIAAAAAASVAVLVVMLAGERLGLPAEYHGVAAVYMATLATRLADAPAGLLRLFDRFTLLTAVRVGEAAAQCLAAAALFTLSAPLAAYVLSFAAVAVATNILLIVCALRVATLAGISLTVRRIDKTWASTLCEFWTFSWVLNLASTIHVVREQAPVLLVGALLGPAPVGLYHVAERIAAVLGMVMWSAHEALYPEVARLATSLRRRADLQWFALRMGVIGGGIGLAALLGTLVFGEVMLTIVGGPGYGQAYWTLLMLIGGYCFPMAGVGLRSAIIVTAGPMKILKANLVPFLPFALLVAPAILQFGIAGVAAAQILFHVLWLRIIISEFRRWLVRSSVDPPREA
jgi:O-antigen/teichoic acid export membrane protein